MATAFVKYKQVIFEKYFLSTFSIKSPKIKKFFFFATGRRSKLLSPPYSSILYPRQCDQIKIAKCH